MHSRGNIKQIAGWRSMLLIATLLISCEKIGEAVQEAETEQVLRLLSDQSCSATPSEGRSLTGTYLRRPAIAALGLDLLLVNGDASDKGLPSSLVVVEGAAPEQTDDDEATASPLRSVVTPRSGFALEGALPNVYSMGYVADNIAYSGPIVVGPSIAIAEIPTAGEQTFRGRIEVSLSTLSANGTPMVTSSIGSFEIVVSYSTKRAQFTATDLGTGSPFDTLSWTNLYQCGGRIVSSGEGRVTTISGGNATPSPFQTGRDPVVINSIFESALFAPSSLPSLSKKIGGIFTVHSDIGTMTGVFLSDPLGT